MTGETFNHIANEIITAIPNDAPEEFLDKILDALCTIAALVDMKDSYQKRLDECVKTIMNNRKQLEQYRDNNGNLDFQTMYEDGIRRKNG